MSDLNVVCLSGRLTRDPDLRNTPSGTAVCEFSIAVNAWNGKEEVANFFECVAWAKSAEFVSKHFAKGAGIVVQGSLQQDRWDGKDGKKRSKVKINVFRAMFPVGGKGAGQPSKPDPAVGPKPFGEDDRMPF